MKKVIIKSISALILVAAFSANSNAKCYQSRTSGGTLNPNGKYTYEKVIQGDPVDGIEQLDCYKPGSNTCKFKDGFEPPSIIIAGTPVTWQDAMDNVQSEINSGNMSGTVNADDGLGSYSWTAVAVNEYEVTYCDGL
ncbi:MAG: hypothetical protein R2800_00915 [Flavipsychrobacter sp.]